MVTIIQPDSLSNNALELRGLSTDAKPTGETPNGSVFLEMDTGNVYFWDKAGNQWRKL